MITVKHWLKSPVTLTVTVDNGDIASERLYLCGNISELGSWKQHVPLLKKVKKNVYSGTFQLPVGSPVFFKVTGGFWGKEEVFRSGHARPNRMIVPRYFSRNEYELTVEGWADDKKPTTHHTLTGTIKKIKKVSSSFLNFPRDILVYLPKEYETKPHKKYPVCFFLDGQNIFDAATAFAGVEWQADETLMDLEEKGLIEPVIAVSIPNSPARLWEYTPTPFMGGGGLQKFAQFILTELFPLLEKKYRIDQNSGKTGIIGSSLGGLAAFHLGWQYPEHFNRIGAVSPSLWWDRNFTLKTVRQVSRKKPLKIWLDMGELEIALSGLYFFNRPRKSINAIRQTLINQGWQDGQDVKVMIDPAGSHDEASWAQRLPQIISFLYGLKPAGAGRQQSHPRL